MKQPFIRSSVYRSLIFSYLIFSLILMILNLSFTSMITKNVLEQHTESYRYTLSDIAKNFEQITDDMNFLISSLAQDSKFYISKDFAYGIISNQYAVTNLKNILNSKSQNVDKLGIYFPDADTIFSLKGIQQSKIYFNTYISNDFSLYNNWLELCTSPNAYFELSPKSDAKISNLLFYKYEAIINNVRAIYFSSAPLHNMYQNISKVYSSSKANIVIQHQRSNIIICNSNFEEKFIEFQESNNKKLIALSQPASLNWTCFLIYENKFFSQPIVQIKLMLFIMIIISIAFIILSSLYFSKKHYLPIMNLMHLFSDMLETEGTDEFTFLQSHIDSLLKKNIAYLSESKRHAKIETLNNVIMGKTRPKDIQDLQKDSTNFPNEYFVVVLIKIPQTFLKKMYDAGYTKENIDTIFTNIPEEIIRRYYNGYVFPLNDMYCCLINSIEIDKAVLQNIFDDVMRLINYYFDINFLVSVSFIKQGYENISSLYKKAAETMLLIEAIGNKRMQFCDDVESNIFSMNFNMNIKNKLVNLIKTGNASAASELFNEIIDEALNNVSTIDMLDQVFFKTLTLLSYTLSTLLSSENYMLLEKYSPSGYIFPCANINELKINIYKYFCTLCSVFNVKDDSSIPLEQRICKYINDNYQNPDLSATMICDAFKIHNTYLSRIFSEKLGTGMHDYITALRIERSKEKLVNTNEKIDNISLSVGYTNSRSFSRAFKRLEGISPKEYRQKHQM